MKKIKWFGSILLCFVIILSMIQPVEAQGEVTLKTVRVGFFSSDGYHMMQEDGSMSGYGFDLLQMMLRYNDWSYEYVGYDKNWGDMLDMLDNGKIDLVTLANKTPEREAKYAFSEKPIGSSATIMSASAGNTEIVQGDYSTYNRKYVGMVTGSAHNDNFERYAKENGFTYTAVYYDSIDDLLEDLRAGNHIDIAVTSNMRVLSGEKVLDEFDATDFYVMMRKSDTELLKQVNTAISQLNINSVNWKTELFDKYYNNINSEVIGLSVEEQQYLNQMKENNYVIKAVMNPELQPYAYFVDGEARGIAPALFRKITENLGIDYEILESSDRWEYKEQLQSGEADIDLTAYLDYSLAQQYNLKETDSYINSTMALLSRKDSNMDWDTMTIAALRDPTEFIGYNNELIYSHDYKEYDSIQECIDAVRKGEVDGTFRYVYIAEQAVENDYTNQLQYTILPEYSFDLAIGILNQEDHRLLSIMNKGVNSLSTSYKLAVMMDESFTQDQKTSWLSVVYDYPVPVAAGLVLITIIVLFFAFLLITNKNQKEKLAVANEVQRFIGYICKSYETVAEIDLVKKQRIIYALENGSLKKTITEHKPFDRDYFEKLVRPEELDRMVEAFSDSKIDEMIATGGEEYFEIEIRDRDEKDHEKLLDTFCWCSYLIIGVPKDKWHPRNFIVFEKDVQNLKEGEEKQKQILRDALEAAKSASNAKGQFLSRMSHEIRTPLNAVIGYMEIAKDSENNPEKIMHCVENSDMAAKHLLRIINDVLDISSIESGRMKIAHEEFDLKGQLSTISGMFFHQAKEKHVKFEVLINQLTEEWVIGDSLRVNQVLMNLLSNAMKFTPEDGKITLKVTQVKLEEKKVFLTFEVSDTGIGMSEEYQKRLFQPFEQESAVTAQKYGGSGLGLSITFNLIQMMGGSIDVQSKQNEGTTFVVSLYFDRSQNEHEQEEKQQDYSKVRALIVDDDKDSCTYIKSLFKRCGVKSEAVTSGEMAIKKVKSRLGSDYEYNLCILDWNMPDMDGLETAKKIKEECGDNLPIVIATGYDVTEFEDQAKEIGIRKVIAKPLFQSTLFDLLVTTFGKYTPKEPEEKKSLNLEGLRILLAEDNPMNMEIALEILGKAGFIVTSAENGKEAVDIFTSQPEGSFDAILMDVQMPIMDGYQATGAIRRSTHPEAKTIPIIAMTANAFAEDVNAALASGMNGHIAKPVNYEKLYEVLNQFCVKKEE